MGSLEHPGAIVCHPSAVQVVRDRHTRMTPSSVSQTRPTCAQAVPSGGGSVGHPPQTTSSSDTQVPDASHACGMHGAPSGHVLHGSPHIFPAHGSPAPPVPPEPPDAPPPPEAPEPPEPPDAEEEDEEDEPDEGEE